MSYIMVLVINRTDVVKKINTRKLIVGNTQNGAKSVTRMKLMSNLWYEPWVYCKLLFMGFNVFLIGLS
jgi:hypothetical protein